MGRSKYTHGAGRVALTAVLAAFSLLFLWGADVAPTGRLGLVAVAGLFPAGAVVSAGLGAGALCYAGSGLLALLLLADKGNGLLYLIFFGLYPLVKHLIERLHAFILEWICKLAFFNAIFVLCWLVLREFLLASLPPFLDQLWMICLAGNVVFVLYDYGFSKVIGFYVARIDRAISR